MNNDGFVNTEDLALFVNMWLSDYAPVMQDIDRDGLVNFSDFAEFAGQWLWEE
ncbi:MAG: dockerin type I domain-containing protein [Planctomycetota bacterium]